MKLKYNAIELAESLTSAICHMEQAVDLLAPILDAKHIDELRAQITQIEELKVEVADDA